jgi:hypothetical protein
MQPMRVFVFGVALAAAASTAQSQASEPSAAPAIEKSVAAAQPDLMTRNAVVEDLTYLRDAWAPKERAFTPESRAQFNAFVADRIAKARPMSRTQLALVFGQGEAYTGNAHSASNYFQVDGLFHTLPISFWTFADGPFVTRAHPSFRDLLGARIVRIEGVPFAEAARRVGPFIAGPAERKRYLVPAFLTRIEVLEAVGLAKNGRSAFEFVLPSGRTRRMVLGATPGADALAANSSWVAALAPPKGSDSWAHVIDAAAARPLYLGDPTELMMNKVGDGSVAYIRSTSLSPYSDDSSLVSTKAYKIIDDLVRREERPRDAVVDLRYNGGGNLFNILAFARELTELIPPDGRIYVITGRTTFSAAIVFAALLKAEAKGRVTIVGEPVTDNLHWWSEGETLTAPNSKLPLHYTTGYHDWANGCSDLDRCYWPVVFHGVAVGTLEPDIPVDETFAQYAAGDDPALDAALADIGRRRRATETRLSH